MSALRTTTINKRNNLAYALFDVADRFPENIAMKAKGGQGKSYTYFDLKQFIEKVAAKLSRPEFRNCKEIGLLSENRPEWGIAYLAIAACGKTVVPIDSNLKEQEINYIIEHSKLTNIFTSVRFETFLSESKPELNLMSFNEGSPNYWLNDVDQNDSFTTDPDNNIAVLIYTSGTTGAPKAVELTQRNLISNLEVIKKNFDFKPSDIFLSLLPLHHTFEATCGFLTPLMSGCTIVYARSLKSKEIAEDIKANKTTVMIGVPLLFEKVYHSIIRKINSAPLKNRLLFRSLYKLSQLGWSMGNRWGETLFKSLREKAGMGSIRFFVSGGAAIPPHISSFYNYIGFGFFQGYGMTETSPVITAQKPGLVTFNSVGCPLGGIEVKIDNPNDNNIGEVIVQGENVTPGYRDNPQATAELIKDGWLHTGDLGRIENNELFITGRMKNLIVSAAGKNIYPEQIEEKLLESNIILESVIFGRTNKNNQGEDVAAIIVPDLDHMKSTHNVDPENPDRDRVYRIIKSEVKRINQDMADYKRVKNFEISLEELEKTSTKKIKRFLYK